jgi:hypothetical protein
VRFKGPDFHEVVAVQWVAHGSAVCRLTRKT